MQTLFEFFQADSIGSVLMRFGIWLGLMTILAFGVGRQKTNKDIKAEAGWFFIFLFVFGGSGYMFFNHTVILF